MLPNSIVEQEPVSIDGTRAVGPIDFKHFVSVLVRQYECVIIAS